MVSIAGAGDGADEDPPARISVAESRLHQDGVQDGPHGQLLAVARDETICGEQVRAEGKGDTRSGLKGVDGLQQCHPLDLEVRRPVQQGLLALGRPGGG
jgi:hypothetical protein